MVETNAIVDTKKREFREHVLLLVLSKIEFSLRAKTCEFINSSPKIPLRGIDKFLFIIEICMDY